MKELDSFKIIGDSERNIFKATKNNFELFLEIREDIGRVNFVSKFELINKHNNLKLVDMYMPVADPYAKKLIGDFITEEHKELKQLADYLITSYTESIFTERMVKGF